MHHNRNDTHVYWKFTCVYIYSHNVPCVCVYTPSNILASVPTSIFHLIDQTTLCQTNRLTIIKPQSKQKSHTQSAQWEKTRRERDRERETQQQRCLLHYRFSSLPFWLANFWGPDCMSHSYTYGCMSVYYLCVSVCVCAWACSACLPLQLPTLASGWLVQYSGLLQGHKNAFGFHARWLRQWSTTATTATTKTIENVKSFHSLNRTSTHSRAYSRDTSNNKLRCN